MKKNFVFIVGIWVLLGCKSSNEKRFIVSGTITNGPDRMLYLEEIPMATMERVIVDSVKPGKDGKFELKAGRRESSLYDLRYDQQIDPVAFLINDASRVSIEANSSQNKQFDYKVEGSVASSNLKEYISFFNRYLSYYLEREQQIMTSGIADSMITRLENERTMIADSLKTFTIHAIGKSENPALGMFELGYFQTTARNPQLKLKGLTNREVSRLVDAIAAQFPAHGGIVLIKNSLQKLDNWVGQMAPEIVLKDVNGKQVSLSSFLGKYVFIDFWASWCPPCRAENPNIVKAWEKYRIKNFDILGVSLDKPGEKGEWLKAIREDRLTWTHVSDLLYWDSPIVPLYRISTLPYNVLVDPNGMVIAESLRGPELQEILAEVLK